MLFVKHRPSYNTIITFNVTGEKSELLNKSDNVALPGCFFIGRF